MRQMGVHCCVGHKAKVVRGINIFTNMWLLWFLVFPLMFLVSYWREFELNIVKVSQLQVDANRSAFKRTNPLVLT